MNSFSKGLFEKSPLSGKTFAALRRRATWRLAQGMAGALLALGTPTALAQTYTYEGQTGTTAAPTSGNFSAGFNDGTIDSQTPTSSGATSLIFGGSNIYTATDNITGGLNIDSLLFSNSGNTTVAGNALTFTGADNTVTNNGTGTAIINAILAGATVTFNGTGPIQLGGANTFTTGTLSTGTTVLLAAASGLGAGTANISGSDTLTLTTSLIAPISLAVTGTNTINVLGTSATMAQFGPSSSGKTLTSSGNATLNINISSGNTFILSEAMAGYSGTIALGGNAGKFQFNNSPNVSFGSTTTLFDLGSTATLLNRNGSATTAFDLGGLQGGSGTVLSGNSGGTGTSNYSIGALNTDTTFSGTIKNGILATLVTKVGTGTLTLGGANTYTGATTIDAGILMINGSLATNSAVTVGGATSAASGTPTLAGSGTVNGSVTLSAAGSGTGAAGAINPGGVGTVGTLTTGAQAYNTGSTVVFDYTSASVDALASTGTVTGISSATFSFNAIGGATLTGPSYTLLTAANDISNVGANALPATSGIPNGYSLQYANSGTQIVLAAAPEPSQWVAFGLGILGLGGLGLRARQRIGKSDILYAQSA